MCGGFGMSDINLDEAESLADLIDLTPTDLCGLDSVTVRMVNEVEALKTLAPDRSKTIQPYSHGPLDVALIRNGAGMSICITSRKGGASVVIELSSLTDTIRVQGHADFVRS